MLRLPFNKRSAMKRTWNRGGFLVVFGLLTSPFSKKNQVLQQTSEAEVWGNGMVCQWFRVGRNQRKT